MLDHVVILWLTFRGIVKLFSIATVPFDNLISRVPIPPHPCQRLFFIFKINYYSHLGVKWYLIVVLIFIFLMIDDVDVLIGYLCIFSGEMSIQVLCAVLSWMIC